MTIKDQVAITQVDQVFRNDGPGPAEGTYVFPLPSGAVVQEFVMWIDGKPIEGEVLPADEARAIYESYVRRNRDPALLEYVGREAVRARIFPIPEGAERRIQIEYTQVLPLGDSLLYYRYPLDTERFSNQPLEQVSIHITVEMPNELRAIYSPSHQDDLVILREDDNRATVSYETRDVYPDKDFELYAGTGTETVGANLLTYTPYDENGYFLLLLTPALPSERSRPLPRDIILTLDTSGSMEGEKLSQAQEALAYVLRHLNPEDRFNVIGFSSAVRLFAPTLQDAGEADAAIDWVYTLEALGGTNIYLALSEAFAQVDKERSTVFIFLTDGLPTEGIVEEDMLLAALSQEGVTSARIFPFGVGYDVNTLLLDRLAQDYRGLPAYIKPDERIDEEVSAFYARIQSPLLTNVSLDFGDVQIYDVYPNPLPDLYHGSQLIVAGRYRGEGRQRLRLKGEIEDKQEEYVYEIDFSNDPEADFLPRLWAARKIGYLLTQIRLSGERDEWVDAVVTLSLRYGIITPYTSFLVEEPEDVLTSEGRDEAMETFKEMPTLEPSGEDAVEDAETRLGLGGAEAPPEAAEVPRGPGDAGSPEEDLRYVRYAGNKAFLCKVNRCIDTTYVPDQMTPQDVIFMSKGYWALVEEHPQWTDYFALAEETIFVAPDGTAYKFRFGDESSEVPQPEAPESDPEEEPPADPPGVAPGSPPTAEPDAPSPATPPAPCPGMALLITLAFGSYLGTRRHR